jgi:hypothetical protein
MTYKLHHAGKELNGNIPCLEFATNLSLYNYIIDLIGKDETTVYLLSLDDEVIVTESLALILDIIGGNISPLSLMEDENGECNIFLQEYYSYEDAYQTALHIKETSPLCYNK